MELFLKKTKPTYSLKFKNIEFYYSICVSIGTLYTTLDDPGLQ